MAAPQIAALASRRTLFVVCMVLFWAAVVVVSAKAERQSWSWWLVFATVPVVMAVLSFLYLDLSYQAARCGERP